LNQEANKIVFFSLDEIKKGINTTVFVQTRSQPPPPPFYLSPNCKTSQNLVTLSETISVVIAEDPTRSEFGQQNFAINTQSFDNSEV